MVRCRRSFPALALVLLLLAAGGAPAAGATPEGQHTWAVHTHEDLEIKAK